jgi:hypothetical protein
MKNRPFPQVLIVLLLGAALAQKAVEGVGAAQLAGVNQAHEQSATLRNWRPAPRSACRRTIARRWTGSSPSQIPRRVMMNRHVR